MLAPDCLRNWGRKAFGADEMATLAHQNSLGGRVTVIVGDITEQDVEAIVNAANSSLLGGGRRRAGLPYLVRRCVDGLAIDKYALGKRLTTNQKLELFREICDAVEYAH